ncbi:MAG: class I SAM-dependent methyltransferase [Pyrinomonadaceae bacterium]
MSPPNLLSKIKNLIKGPILSTSIGRKSVAKVLAHKQKLETKQLLRSQLEQSEKDAESVAQWWNKCHSTDRNFSFWLTGSRGPEVWSSLKIEDRIGPNQTVLNIGVGEGHCTRGLSERGCQVHALDISPMALAKISNCVVKTWLPSQLEEIPSDTFDLAISHLVTQHMSDTLLDQQLREVVRSLNAGGVFAMQFAYRLSGNEEEIEQSEASSKNGGICRSLETMRSLVAGAGGRIVWSEKIGTFPEFDSGWHAIHIQKEPG